METQSILTLIIAIIFFIFGLALVLSGINHKKILIFVSLIISGFFMFLTAKVEGYNKGQIDSLKGKQKFEMKIRYEYIDHKYIPIDTTFILIDSTKFFPLSDVKFPLKERLKKRFIESIIRKETQNRNVINHKEDAVGYLQIRPVMVKDINRILGEDRYTLEDRWDKKKSIEMFIIYQNYYNPEWNFEKGARIWNGGPNGYLEESTVSYWEDVKSTIFS